MKKSTLQASLFFLCVLGALTATGQTLTLQPGPTDGMDLRLCSVPGYSTSSGTELPADAWTYQGTAGVDHSFIYFDISTIPAGALITNAQLSLYGASDLPSGAHSTLSGSNAWLIQRITSTWNLSTTWATSPTVTTANQVSMPASTSSDQNFQANVTAMVQDMVNNPQSSFGFMLKLQTESYYRRVNFASRNYSDPAKRPKLVITYTSTAGITESIESTVSIYPNPTENGMIRIQLNEESGALVELYSLLGEKVYTNEVQGKDTCLDLSFLEKGVYQLKLYTDKGVVTKKVELL